MECPETDVETPLFFKRWSRDPTDGGLGHPRNFFRDRRGGKGVTGRVPGLVSSTGGVETGNLSSLLVLPTGVKTGEGPGPRTMFSGPQ